MGWLLLGLGLSLPWSDVLDGCVDYGQLARPGSLPAARYLAVYSPAVFMAGLACAGFVLLLTPSGSLPSSSRRWHWWARAWAPPHIADDPQLAADNLRALTLSGGRAAPGQVGAAKPIRVGDNVWLGGGVIIGPGVSIGENTVVGAGAVVVRELPANVVAVGNPARVVRSL